MKNKKTPFRSKEIRVGTVDEATNLLVDIARNPKRMKHVPKEGVIYVKPDDLPKLLSKERLRLMHELRNNPVSITRLAEHLQRKRESVSRDIGFLAKQGLVQVKQRGREVYPTTANELRIIL